MNYAEQSENNTMTKINEQDHQHNDYNKAHAAGRFMTPEDCECIKDAYLANIADSMTGAVAHMIEQAFEKGLTASEIVMAIEETGFAPRPSPYYLKAILERWAEYGVTVSKIRHLSRMNHAEPWWK